MTDDTARDEPLTRPTVTGTGHTTDLVGRVCGRDGEGCRQYPHVVASPVTAHDAPPTIRPSSINGLRHPGTEHHGRRKTCTGTTTSCGQRHTLTLTLLHPTHPFPLRIRFSSIENRGHIDVDDQVQKVVDVALFHPPPPFQPSVTAKNLAHTSGRRPGS